MKNHWSLKLTAFVMAMLSAVLTMYGCFGMVFSQEVGFLENRRERYDYGAVYDFCDRAAQYVVGTYAQQHSGASEAFFRQYIYWDYPELEELSFDFDYRLMDDGQRTLANTRGSSGGYEWTTTSQHYVVHSTLVEMPDLSWYPNYDEYMAYLEESGALYYEDELTGAIFPSLTEGTYAYAYGYEDGRTYRIDYTGTDYYTVEICLTGETLTAMGQLRDYSSDLGSWFRIHSFRAYAIATAIGAAVLLLSLVWLGFMAGKSPRSFEIRPRGLNAMPLDLYAFGLFWVAAGLVALVLWLADYALYVEQEDLWLWLAIMVGDGACCGLGLALACAAITAQFRARTWLTNTLIGRCGGWLWGLLRRTLGPLVRMCRELVGQLPLIWQWVVCYGGLLLIALLAAWASWELLSMLLLLAGTPLVVYSAWSFGKLRAAADRMAQGGLDAKIDLERDKLHGCFREFAQDLNELGEVCVDAAREQMKHERMKSELITNVSHDIKTPLTSIINYVDLLQHAQSEEQRAEYLEVLERQSQRLKKLIEDLMEMSKASSGNIAVDFQTTDLCEGVNQALGEFADALVSRDLTVLLKRPPEPLLVRCDGRLLWRVMSNLLSNVVKYAMGGTRVYVDVVDRGDRAELSVKNISAQPLNVSAEELMERFVRGDASRSAEGNGLGLNIARSLMEAQQGSLDLVVDGDLFKAVLTLPVDRS